VVAVCDVNARAAVTFPGTGRGKESQKCGREPARRLMDANYAKQQPSGNTAGSRAYNDYRELLEKENIDAVMIATLTTRNAVITMAALKRGKHVYCEKPLTWSVHEARQVTEARAGPESPRNAGTRARLPSRRVWCARSSPTAPSARCAKCRCGARRVSGAGPLGKAAHRHAARARGLGLGPLARPRTHRPYHPAYSSVDVAQLARLRHRLIGDLGLHKLSTVFKTLNLGHPISVEASATKLSNETFPLGEIVRFDFPRAARCLR